MKKIAFLLLFLVASLGTWAVNWSSIEWLGDGAGGGTYANKYKVETGTGISVVNIQQWAEEIPGIYVTAPVAISNSSVTGMIQGAGILMYLENFTEKVTTVTIEDAVGTVYTFQVYYADGTGEEPSVDPGVDPDPDPDPDPVIPTGEETILTNGDKSVSLLPVHYTDIEENNYVLTITSETALEGLGGSFWYLNGSEPTDVRNGLEKVDANTLVITVTSTADPKFYTPLYVMMPGEVNFGDVTLTWIEKTTTTTAISAVEGASTVSAIYSANGTQLAGMQKGLNIIRLHDGSTRKVMK